MHLRSTQAGRQAVHVREREHCLVRQATLMLCHIQNDTVRPATLDPPVPLLVCFQAHGIPHDKSESMSADE